MSKDPAFLFYPGDWLGGTLLFSREQKGAYMDLLMAQFNHGHMTRGEIEVVLGGDYNKMWESVLKKKFKLDEGGLYYNERLEYEKLKRQRYSQSRKESRTKADEDNVRIYLLEDLDTGYIKIGSSVNPVRRYNEIANQTVSVSGSSKNRNYKLLWYSNPTIRAIEKVLHLDYKQKRIKGEWFELNNKEIEEIKLRMGERMLQHTENENKDRDKDIKEDENKKNLPINFLSDIISYLNKKVGSSFKPTTMSTIRHIKARHNEGYTITDFKKVIDIKYEEWHNNSDMVNYLRPETLFGTKFEGYLNQKENSDEYDPEKFKKLKEKLRLMNEV